MAISDDIYQQQQAQPDAEGVAKRPWLRILGLTLLLISILTAGAYWYWQQKRQTRITSLIPADAIALVEVQNPVHTFQRMKRQPYWPWMQRINELHVLQDQFMAVKLAVKRDTNLLSFSEQHPAYISVHARGEAKLGYVFYLPIQSISDADRLRKIADDLIPQAKARRSNRKYSGHNILDILIDDTTTLSVLPLEHFWAISYHGQLIDDVARQQAGHSTAPWLADFLKLDVNTEAGIKLAVNGAQMQSWLAIAVSQPLVNWSQAIIQGANVLGGWNKTGLELSGTYTVTEGNLLDSASAGSLEALQWAPHNTAMLYHLADGARLAHWLALKGPNSSTHSQADLRLQANITEVMVAEVEHPDPEQHPTLMALRTKDPAALQDWVRAQTASGQLATGQLGDQSWHQQAHGNLGQQILNQNILGFDQAYYITTSDGWLIVGSSLQVISQALQDEQEGLCWLRNPDITPYLQHLNDGHKALIAFNPKRYLNLAAANILPRWLPMAESYCQPQSGIGFVTIQASESLGQSELNVVISPPTAEPPNTDPPVHNLRASYLPGYLLGTPKVWRHPTDRGLGCVVTDTLNQLYFIDKKGGVAHQYPMRQPLVTDVWKTDQPINLVAGAGNVAKQSQWYALTLGGLHALSAEAQVTKGYPLCLPDTLLPASASIISYGGQTAQRWQLTERNGNVWLFDNKGKALAPFNPLRFRTSLVGNLAHYQVGDQDVLMAIEYSGTIHLLSRKGEELPGWPVTVGHRCHHQPLVRTSTTLANSSITILTEQGQVRTYSFEGQMVSQLQLLRASANTKFSMAIETKGQTYSLMAAEGDSILVYNPLGVRVAKFAGPGYGQAAVQYYHFGAGNQVWAVRPPIEATGGKGMVWLHTRSGLLGGGAALATDYPISMLYSDASHAWFVLRNAGHLTCLTAVRQVGAPAKAPGLFVEDNITMAKPVRTIPLGKDTLQTIPYWPSNTLLIQPNQSELTDQRDAVGYKSAAAMALILLRAKGLPTPTIATKLLPAVGKPVFVAPTTTTTPDEAKHSKVGTKAGTQPSTKPTEVKGKAAKGAGGKSIPKTITDPKAVPDPKIKKTIPVTKDQKDAKKPKANKLTDPKAEDKTTTKSAKATTKKSKADKAPDLKASKAKVAKPGTNTKPTNKQSTKAATGSKSPKSGAVAKSQPSKSNKK